MNKLLVLFVLLLSTKGLEAQGRARQALKLMGCGFELTVLADNDSLAWQALEAGKAEIQRIETLISSWDPNSQTSAINRQAGLAPVKVDKELYDLISRSLKVSQLTQGAFDVSFAGAEGLWSFKRDTLAQWPDSQVLEQVRQRCDWQAIVLNAQDTSVFLQKKGMKIGFGAIGKGYAANRAQALMSQMQGVQGGVVNASGDLRVWGEKSWPVQIINPDQSGKIIGTVYVKNGAIVTSGDYEKFFIHQGRRYAHIINPRTASPVTGIKSVTVVCPDAEIADALATSIFVLGKDQGLRLLNALQGVEGLIITDDNQWFSSQNFKIQ